MATTDSLAGEVALVTGASSGIGRAAADALARDGADVALVSRTEAVLEEVADDLRDAHGVEALAAPADVTDPDAIDAAVEGTVEAFGRLDVVVNSAGIGRPEAVSEMPTEGYRQITGVNVDGAFFTARATIPHLRESGGTLVFLGSFAGCFPYPNNPVYGATKWWTRGFALSLAGALGEDDVAVTLISPSETRTDFAAAYAEPYADRYEPGEVAEPADVAEAIVFAARQDPPNAVTELDLFRRDKFAGFGASGSM